MRKRFIIVSAIIAAVMVFVAIREPSTSEIGKEEKKVVVV
jgi:hypothetical protein